VAHVENLLVSTRGPSLATAASATCCGSSSFSTALAGMADTASSGSASSITSLVASIDAFALGSLVAAGSLPPQATSTLIAITVSAKGSLRE
jgi:hypothetical protein